MTLRAALRAVDGYETGDLDWTVATLAGWATTGLVEPETDWLLCNGAAIPNSGRYADLYAKIGGTLPNLIDGVQPVQIGASQVVGMLQTRGAKVVTLSAQHLPSLPHAWSDWGPDGGFNGSQGITQSTGVSDGGDVLRQTDTQGGGGAHNNMPPYVVIEGMMVRL